MLMRQHVRSAFLGLAIGAALAFSPACTKKCDASNCQGCCSSSNECLPGDTTAACGLNGSACVPCTDGACALGACDSTLNPDGGAKDAGPGTDGPLSCMRDSDCSVLKNGSVCDTRAGVCVVGRGCNADNECQFSDETDPCWRSGIQCRCDKRDAPDGGSVNFAGTCRQRAASCEECQFDSDCGDDSAIFGPPDGRGEGKCRQLTGDSSGKKYCFYKIFGSCPCGMQQDNEGLCRPQSNSCAEVGCRNNKDCPSGSVCSVDLPAGSGGCGGLCKPRCRWDFSPDQRRLVEPGCPPGEVCWVDSENLDPKSIYFGSGRCKAPCSGDADCKKSASNPFGGDNLKCAGELLKGGGRDLLRCRADGDCMDSAECPVLSVDQPYLGFCDATSFTCKENTCRTEDDPITGRPYKDCRSPYACKDTGATNECILLSCTEQGGASVACRRGQYCCGDDKNGDNMPDPCPPPAERDPAGCYDIPTPPFCQTCDSHEACANPQLPGWMTGTNACANGSKSPSCSPLKSLCVNAGPKDGMEGVNICAPATFNDVSQNSAGVPRAQVGCPAGYSVNFLRPVFTDGDSTCGSDADCNQGTDAGVCETDPELRLADGGRGKSCRCSAGTGRAQCPNTPDGGVYSECRSGVPGQRTYCVESVVCMPNPGTAYLPKGAPQYGCGL